MPVREAPDRRGRAERGSQGLLERDDALAAIREALEDAERDIGTALLIEGHAGMGKTRLYEAALDDARNREMLVLRAAGAELEQNLAFGMAGQLLLAQLSELPAARRRSLLDGAPETVRALAGVASARPDSPGELDLTLSHWLFTLLATADESRSTLIAVDDLHWCDQPSLEFLLYALHRAAEVSFAFVLTLRSGALAAASPALDRIATHPRVRIQRLPPLHESSVGELVRRTLGPRADAEVTRACLRATAGNPFYVHELLAALREDVQRSGPELARQAQELAPDGVIRSLRVRVGRLGKAAMALAAAVTILGDDVPLRRAAALAGLPLSTAADAADRLASVEVLLAREPLRFVHPLVRHAIADDVPPAQRAGRHLDAARLLYADGAAPERVAAHLILARPQDDPWVVETLRDAAREARARGAAESAVRYLERALNEPPPAQQRGEIMAELGMAEAAAGMPSATHHLERALAHSKQPARRAELALELGRALNNQGLHERAAGAFDRGLAELPDEPDSSEERELRHQLAAGGIVSGTMIPSLERQALERSTEFVGDLGTQPVTQGQRLVLALAARRASFAGEPAGVVRELAERAWDGGQILDYAASQWIGWRLVSSSLCLSGALERSVAVAETAIEVARNRASPLQFATASYAASLPRLWQGQVGAALADLESARDARRYGWREFIRAAAANYTLCLVEQDRLDEADSALTEDAPLGSPVDLEDALRLYALGELRLAQGRTHEALDAALRTGELVERWIGFFGLCPWRTLAAQAARGAGQPERALELARDAAERATRVDVPHLRIRTLRVLGMCQGEQDGIESLREAVRLGERSAPRLETVRALVELGAALRRANQRSAAREPLAQATDMAAAGGLTRLYEQARTELAATGARPRRERLISGRDALTPSELRIAELAAAGQSNREIATALFVTPKTVEYHLRNAYRKLDIVRRGDLKHALSPER